MVRNLIGAQHRISYRSHYRRIMTQGGSPISLDHSDAQQWFLPKQNQSQGTMRSSDVKIILSGRTNKGIGTHGTDGGNGNNLGKRRHIWYDTTTTVCMVLSCLVVIYCREVERCPTQSALSLWWWNSAGRWRGHYSTTPFTVFESGFSQEGGWGVERRTILDID